VEQHIYFQAPTPWAIADLQSTVCPIQWAKDETMEIVSPVLEYCRTQLNEAIPKCHFLG